MKKILIAGALALATAGCIVKETHHTLYLEPDGSLTWTVVEERVRSDADTAEKRDREEAQYLAQIDSEYPLATALSSLGGFEAQTHLVRKRRPYLVVTEANFDSVADLTREILDRFGVPGRVDLSLDGDEHILEIDIWTDEVDDSLAAEDDPISELIDGSHRIVLTEGRFVRATGFTLEEGGRVAIPLEVSEEELERDAGRLRLSLVWTSE